MKCLLFLLFSSALFSEMFDSRMYSFRSPQDGSFAQQVYKNFYRYPWMFNDSLEPFAVLPIREDSVFDEYINVDQADV